MPKALPSSPVPAPNPSTISAVNKGLDEALARFAHRHLDEPYPYLILDARYERVGFSEL